MTLAEIRERYGVPAEVGMRVSYDGRKGSIMGPSATIADGLRINFPSLIYYCWVPCQRLTYYNDDGEVIWRPE